MNKKCYRNKYNLYDSNKWEKAYFDENSGGFLVVDKQRLAHSTLNKNEKTKFLKEFNMSLVLTKNGYEVELLKEISRIPSPDAKINGILAEFKSLSSHNNIVKEAKDAVRKKGAKIVVFEFEHETEKIYKQILILQKKSIHGKYFFTNKEKVYDF